MRQIDFYDLLLNANLWRKARGILRIRLSGVAWLSDGRGVLN